MNTLTPNRLLMKGDEYLDPKKGEWRAIPDGDIGLQVMFTKYQQVRRPTENGAEVVGTPAPSATESKPTEKPSAPPPPPIEYPKAKPLTPPSKGKEKELPTVVSRKAHLRKILSAPDVRIVATEPAIASGLMAKVHAAVEASKPKHPKTGSASIPYSDLSNEPVWIGRNGTFKAKAINLSAGHGKRGGLIQIRPAGSRGLAKNALIEFPAADIPKVVDFLLRHQIKPV